MDINSVKRIFALMAMACYTRIENLSKQEQSEFKELLNECEPDCFGLDEESKLRGYVLWVLKLVENDPEYIHEKIQKVEQLKLL